MVTHAGLAGDMNMVKQYKPTDCTTNPSLVLKAVQMPEYEHYLGDAIAEEQKSDNKYSLPDRPFAGARVATQCGSMQCFKSALHEKHFC